MDGRTDGRTDGQMKGWTDGQMSGRREGRTDRHHLLWKCVVASKKQADNSRDFKFGRGMNCLFKMFLEKTKKICFQYDENGEK